MKQKFLTSIFSMCLMAALAVSMAVLSPDAWAAKRLGGGKSVGKQSSNVTQREAAPAAPAAPAAVQAAKPAAPAAAPAAQAPKRPWGAMLGGLAAGLGLAWLANSLGLGEAFGQFLMIGLIALALMMGFAWFMRRRAAQVGAGSAQPGGYALAGAGAGAGNNMPPEHAPMQRNYQPDNIGNDASARPWERNSTSYYLDPNANPSNPAPASGSMIGSRLTTNTAPNWSVPADFDAASFLATAKQAFVNLQAAWDKNDINTMRSMMTDEMLTEIRQQLAERDQHTGASANHTEVVSLDAKLLGIEDLGADWLASVEFSGMIKEDPSTSPAPFREVWNMGKPKDGSAGWLVAGLQALH